MTSSTRPSSTRGWIRFRFSWPPFYPICASEDSPPGHLPILFPDGARRAGNRNDPGAITRAAGSADLTPGREIATDPLNALFVEPFDPCWCSMVSKILRNHMYCSGWWRSCCPPCRSWHRHRPPDPHRDRGRKAARSPAGSSPPPRHSRQEWAPPWRRSVSPVWAGPPGSPLGWPKKGTKMLASRP